jgi:hypothetical protein
MLYIVQVFISVFVFFFFWNMLCIARVNHSEATFVLQLNVCFAIVTG